MPQIGAVLVPINYRLTADDFVYIINHCGASIVCAHADYLEAVDGIRDQLPKCRALRRAGRRARPAGSIRSTLEGRVAASSSTPTISEDDLLTINYTSGTTSRPKGVMITHRNAYMNAVGTLMHVHMTPADRYLWTLPMFHANGWTFVWIVTAVGATHVCLRRSNRRAIFALIRQEHVTMLCAAPTVLIAHRQRPEELRRNAPTGVRVLTAGAPPAAATIERIEGELGWTITQVYGLTETAPFITICEPRPGARRAIRRRSGRSSRRARAWS